MEYDDSLKFIFAGHVESDGELGDDLERFEPDSELEDTWEEFKDAAQVVLKAFPGLDFDALDENEEHWDADVFHTLTGAGVGVWDGCWDAYTLLLSIDAKGVAAELKTKLGEWADVAGGGKLADAFTECAQRQLSPAVMAVQVEGDGNEHSEAVYEGDATVRIAINEEGDQPQAAPLGWCNSARIHANASNDEITLCISTGDPRGAFAMTVRRKPDGTILLHLPHPEESLLHEELKKLHPGTFAIAHTIPKEVDQG